MKRLRPKALMGLILCLCAVWGVGAKAKSSQNPPRIDVSSVLKQDKDNGLPKDWQRSATFIEIFVRSYQDSNGDGIGDFKGLTQRLDYLQALGITGIWLMPMNPSTDNDHGYAVSDYRDVHKDYGTMKDFETFLSEAHKRGIGVIIDYVINHSGSDNPLFQSAKASKHSPYRNWYLIQDTNPGWVALADPQGSGFYSDPWRQIDAKNKTQGYFYGLFDTIMPDFNLKNAKVIDYHLDNMRFWLNKGVDGFRIDAVTMLVENGPKAYKDQPENLPILKSVNDLIKSYTNRYLICEASDQPALYAGDGACGQSFAFGTQGEIKTSARTGKLSAKLVEQLNHPKRHLMPLVLQSHDSYVGDRLINDFGDTAEGLGAYRVAAAISILASDVPFSYYGEEIAMSNNGNYNDPGLRTPMSWTADKGAGFTTAPKPYRAYASNQKTHQYSNFTEPFI
jgi:alpha-amylase